MDSPSDVRRTFVLGLDGVPWDLLEGWIAADRLPNFGRLAREGAAGSLRSTVPPNTPTAWPSIATGRWPAGHGIHDFMKLLPSHDHRPYTREDLRSPALWEMLSPAVVGNVPMTYPAGGVEGTMVAGMMTPEGADGFTAPSEFESLLRARIPAYRVGLKWHQYGDDREGFLRDLERLLEARRELLDLLMETDEWRLFFFTFTAPDRLQHLVWEEDVLLDHYRTLDAILGDVIDYCEERGSNLFVVSDHGFGPVSEIVSVNRLLADGGFLEPKGDEGVRRLLSASGITKSRLLGGLATVGIDEERLLRYLPTSLVASVAARVPGGHGLYDIDFRNTSAFLHGRGNVYVNDEARFDDGVVPASERGAVASEVTAYLSAREPLEVYRGDDLFPGHEFAPDAVVQPRDGYHVVPSLEDEAITGADGVAAYHRPSGVFFARGPHIDAGAAPREASVVDVAPTVLHSVGEPIPAASDGRVLEEVFAPGSAPAERAVREEPYASGPPGEGPEADFEELEERLRGLGYL